MKESRTVYVLESVKFYLLTYVKENPTDLYNYLHWFLCKQKGKGVRRTGKRGPE